MRKIRGDIIEMARTRYAVRDRPFATWLLVPINRVIKKHGELVMGAGLAKTVAERWPMVPWSFATQLRAHPHQMPFFGAPLDRHGSLSIQLVGFSTKHDYNEASNIGLMIRELGRLQTMILGDSDLITVLMPHLGCGCGGLSWEQDVLPIVQSMRRACRRKIVICDLNEKDRPYASEGETAFDRPARR